MESCLEASWNRLTWRRIVNVNPSKREIYGQTRTSRIPRRVFTVLRHSSNFWRRNWPSQWPVTPIKYDTDLWWVQQFGLFIVPHHQTQTVCYLDNIQGTLVQVQSRRKYIWVGIDHIDNPHGPVLLLSGDKILKSSATEYEAVFKTKNKRRDRKIFTVQSR